MGIAAATALMLSALCGETGSEGVIPDTDLGQLPFVPTPPLQQSPEGGPWCPGPRRGRPAAVPLLIDTR